MDLRDLKRLTDELELIATALRKVKSQAGRFHLHKKALSIIQKIEKGSGEV
jgi:hypothetical protein